MFHSAAMPYGYDVPTGILSTSTTLIERVHWRAS
jgi:hypothetical protein